MPLIKGKSQKSFVKNLKSEMHAGKPMKQSLAIAYSMKRKAEKKKYADGGGPDKDDVKDPVDAGADIISKSIPSKNAKAMSSAFGESESKYAKGGNIKGVHRSAYDEDHPKDKISKSLAGESEAGEEVRKAVHYADIHGDESGSQTKYEQKMKKAIPEHHKILGELKSMPKPKLKGLAYGGQIKDNYQSSGKPEVDREFSHEPAEFASGYMSHEGNDVKSNEPAMSEEHKKLNQHAVDMMASTSMSEQDIVDRIMEKRSQDFSGLDRYSEGGRVANDTGEGQEADCLPNQFDDLVLRDDLESDYGDDDNSGDALGNEQEDEDRHDIVARIMSSWKKKDKLPNPR